MKNLKYFLMTFILFVNINLYSQWFSLDPPISNYHYSCYFVNAQTGWVSGDGMKLFYTSTGGLNWQILDPPNQNDRSESMFFVNANTGFIGSYSGRIYKTTDAGISWTFTQVSNYSQRRVMDIYFINEQTGWAVGQMGIFRKTVNGGMSWNIASGFFSTEDLRSVFFRNEHTGWVLGRSTTCITKTTNGGSTWITTNFALDPFYYRFNGVTFIDEFTGWAYGSSGLVAKTTDAGFSWEIINIQPTNSNTFYFYTKGHFMDSNIGYLSGLSYTPGPSTSQSSLLRKTIDGGSNWSFINICCSQAYEDMHFVNNNTGYVVGQNKILKSTNAGLVNVTNFSEQTPENFVLEQNFPNPFNPITRIKFSVPLASFISLTVYNISGKEIAVLANGFKQRGIHEVDFDAVNIASGIYFYTLTAGDFKQTKRMLLLK